MDNFLAVITFASLVCTAGFCEGGNFIAATACIGVLGIATVVINKRYECEQRRKEIVARAVIRRADRAA